MDPDVQEELSYALNPGEYLLWGDRAYGGLVWRSSDLAATMFGLAWCAMVAFMTYQAYHNPKPNAQNLKFMLALMQLIAIYALFGRFYVDIWKRSCTVYGLTAGRVLIVRKLLFRKILTVDLKTATSITYKQKANGRGAIIFGPESYELEEPLIQFGRHYREIVYNPYRLDLARDAIQIYDMIQAQIGAAKK